MHPYKSEGYHNILLLIIVNVILCCVNSCNNMYREGDTRAHIDRIYV